MSELNLRRVILDLAVEDSYALSELVARVRQVRPRMTSAEATMVVKNLVQDMIEHGLLQVLWLEDPESPEQSLDSERARRALEDDLMWHRLSHWRPHARIAATTAGKSLYYEDPRVEKGQY